MIHVINWTIKHFMHSVPKQKGPWFGEGNDTMDRKLSNNWLYTKFKLKLDLSNNECSWTNGFTGYDYLCVAYSKHLCVGILWAPLCFLERNGHLCVILDPRCTFVRGVAFAMPLHLDLSHDIKDWTTFVVRQSLLSVISGRPLSYKWISLWILWKDMEQRTIGTIVMVWKDVHSKAFDHIRYYCEIRPVVDTSKTGVHFPITNRWKPNLRQVGVLKNSGSFVDFPIT